ncbi:XRCC3 family protein [Megaselia abdita]
MSISVIYYDRVPDYLKRIIIQANLLNPRKALVASYEHYTGFGVKEQDIITIRRVASEHVMSKLIPVNNFFQPKFEKNWSRISFKCDSLDKITNGGILTRGITEIFGESGAGKTQLLLQLSLSVQLPEIKGGLQKGVALICTEDVFPAKRLVQISESFYKKYPEEDIKYLSNIFIEHVVEPEELLNCVNRRLPILMARYHIGLIIIDSVAAVFRSESNAINRSLDIRQLVSSLLRLSHQYNCGVICVNQVAYIPKKRKITPCLGLVFANLSRTRIKISKIPRLVNFEGRTLTARRMEVVFSPESPCEVCDFIITSDGVNDCPKH